MIDPENVKAALVTAVAEYVVEQRAAIRFAVERLPSYIAPKGTHGSDAADAYWSPSVSLRAVLDIIDARSTSVAEERPQSPDAGSTPATGQSPFGQDAYSDWLGSALGIEGDDGTAAR